MNEYIVSAEQEGMRLDVFLTEQMEGSRSYIQSLIKGGHVTVGDKVGKANLRLTPDTVIHVEIPEPESIEVKPEDIPLDYLYEDHDIVIVNKPRGMVVHPAVGNYSGTLVNALLFHCKDLSGINGEIRPGIVHRLDKDTSGALVIARTMEAQTHLVRQLQDRSMSRRYRALASGITQEQGTVDKPIGRDPRVPVRMSVERPIAPKPAITHYQLLQKGEFEERMVSLLECRLETGRTHQIRVHMASIAHPLLGDQLYGSLVRVERQMLHAFQLGFIDPLSGDKLEFNAPIAQDMQDLIAQIQWLESDA